MPLVVLNDPFNYSVWDRVSLKRPTFGANFEVTLEALQHFKPEEITIKLSDDRTVIVERKHEEEDEQGSVSRHFIKKFFVPAEFDVSKIQGQLYSDGILTVTAPRVKTGNFKGRSIPVRKVNSENHQMKSKL